MTPGTQFQDEFTLLTLTQLGGIGTPNIVISESTTGPTTYVATGVGGSNTYIINSDPIGTTAVGGQVTLAGKLAVLAPYLGLASVIATAAAVAVIYRKRAKDKDNN